MPYIMQAQNEEEVGHILEPSPYYYMPNHKQGTNHTVGLASPLRRYQQWWIWFYRAANGRHCTMLNRLFILMVPTPFQLQSTLTDFLLRQLRLGLSGRLDESTSYFILATYLNGNLFEAMWFLDSFFSTRTRRYQCSSSSTPGSVPPTVVLCGCRSKAALTSCVVRHPPIYAWEFLHMRPTSWHERNSWLRRTWACHQRPLLVWTRRIVVLASGLGFMV
jgi:hypothetical protein